MADCVGVLESTSSSHQSAPKFTAPKGTGQNLIFKGLGYINLGNYLKKKNLSNKKGALFHSISKLLISRCQIQDTAAGSWPSGR